MRLDLFSPIGKTVAMSISTSSESDPFTPPAMPGAMGNAVRIFNAGPNTVFVNFGPSSVVAAIPVENTPADGKPIPSGMVEIWPKGVHTHIAGICGSSESAVIYMTIGDGA